MSTHKKSSADTKSQKAMRNLFSFLLFLTIVAFSASALSCVGLTNAKNYADIFTNNDYVEALYDDVKQYSYDICDMVNMPHSVADEAVTYDAVYEIAESYAYGVMGCSDKYSKSSYEGFISDMNESIISTANTTIKQNKIKYSGDQKKNTAKFASSITDYVKGQVEFEFMDKLLTVINIGKTISVVVMIISLVLGAVLVLITSSIGNRKYRGLRAVAYSFIASCELQLLSVAAMGVLKHYKTLTFYPTYLCNSVMRFIDNFTFDVAVSGILSFVVALVVMTFVWKKKRDQK